MERTWSLSTTPHTNVLRRQSQLHSSMGPTLQLCLQEIRVHQSIPAKESRRHPEANQDIMLQNPTASNPRVRLYSLGPTLEIRRRQARAHPAQICSLCLQRSLPGDQRHCDASHPRLGHAGRKEREIPRHHDVSHHEDQCTIHPHSCQLDTPSSPISHGYGTISPMSPSARTA